MNIIYSRISKDSSYQDNSHQLSSCEAFCKKNNITIDKIITDENVSAYSKDINAREGFAEIIHLAEQGKLENLVVFETSRISRQFIQGQTIIDEFTRKGIKIWSVVDNACVNQSELDQLMNAFKFWMNQKASKETSNRVKSQKALAKSEGKYLGHKIIPGFKVVDGYEVINEEEVPLVHKMFDTYINQGSKATMKELGIQYHQTLHKRLKNPKYIQIVGQSKFDLVQKLMNSRRCNSITKGLNRSDVLFEGLLYHKFCGSKLTIYRDRKDRPLFRCRKCKGDETVNVKKSFAHKIIDNLEQDIIEILDTLDHDKLVERYNSRCGKNKSIINYQINELNNLLKSKEKALKMANAKLERYIMQDVSDNIIENISNMITNVKSEINDIVAELEQNNQKLSSIIVEEQHQEDMIKQVLEIKDIYKSASNNKKKAILNLLIKKIEVEDIDKYDIYLNI